MDKYLMHVGVGHLDDPPGRGSGRWAWGSGEHAYQRLKGDFLVTYQKLQHEGHDDKKIAEFMEIKSFNPKTGKDEGDIKRLRAYKQIAVMQDRAEKRALALEIYDKHVNKKTGKVNISAAAREYSERTGTHTGDTSFKSLINDDIHARKQELQHTMDLLEDAMKEKKYIDVGVGTFAQMGLRNQNQLDTALLGLEAKGYHLYNVRVKQLGTGHMTTRKVLAPPDAAYGDVFKEMEEVKPFLEKKVYDTDGKITKLGLEPYATINPERVMIRYNEEGGKDKDGVIELRQGVPDLSLGKAHYAQVRIAVDSNKDGEEDHFLKGMAMYAPNGGKDMPKGVDIIFNTNKHVGTDFDKVLKEVKHVKDAEGNDTGKIDKENPFGASIKREVNLKMAQKYYEDPKTGEKKLSAINIVNEEGDWSLWSKTLSSQFLAKQTEQLADKQLKLALAEKKDEYDEIKKLTNATIQKELLIEFADNCDSAAVHLKAAALPHQGAHVILPLPNIKKNEVYAPNYENGTEVVLVRYPHAGRFEIPRLVVNNNSRIAKDIMGSHPSDAIGIHPSVAEVLSGADFDGDTVMVMPTKAPSGRKIADIKTEDRDKVMPGLVDFEPKELYKGYEGMKVISGQDKQKKMGEVSNLITDMTQRHAPYEEMERAVKLSMLIIDAEKHKLDYKRAYQENDITELKQKYQPKDPDTGKGGANTIISRAKSEERVPLRKQWYASNNTIDPKTGKKIQRLDTEYGTWTDYETGEVHQRTSKSTRMAEVDDARKLMSGPNHKGTPMEQLYADYANELKAMANQARLDYLEAGKHELKRSPTAAKAYAKEVDSLKYKLLMSQKDQPYERMATAMANIEYNARERENPGADSEQKKKWRWQALAGARAIYGVKREPIKFTDREWEAIQAGAIGKTDLHKLMQFCDKDELKNRAMPRSDKKSISDAKIARIKAMANSSLTQKEIAEMLGVSPSVVSKVLSNRYKAS